VLTDLREIVPQALQLFFDHLTPSPAPCAGRYVVFTSRPLLKLGSVQLPLPSDAARVLR